MSLARELRLLADARLTTPCQDAAQQGAHAWIDEDADARAVAAGLCAPCPLIDACLDHALTTDVVFGVWGGVDLSDQRTRRALRRTRKARTA